MTSKNKPAAKVFELSIEGEMTIIRAEELKEAILPVIANHEEIEIDLSHVTEIDGAGLLLMISAKLETWQRKKTLRFVGHSGSITEAVDFCDLSTFFGDPIVLSSQSANKTARH